MEVSPRRGGAAGPIVSAGAIAIGSRGSPALLLRRPRGFWPSGDVRWSEGFQRDPRPSGRSFGLPSLLKYPRPPPVFILKMGTLRPQSLTPQSGRTGRTRSRTRLPPPRGADVPSGCWQVFQRWTPHPAHLSFSKATAGSRLRCPAETHRGDSPGERETTCPGPPRAPAQEHEFRPRGAHQWRQGAAPLATAVTRDWRALMTSGAAPLATAVTRTRPRCPAAWTRPLLRTAFPRKCPSTGRRTTSSS